MRKGTLLFLLIATAAAAQGQKRERIITAGSAMTETVCALGLCEQLIASDRTSLYPPKVQKLPSIGYRTNIHAEGIIGLQPGYLVAEKDYVDNTVIKQVSSAGVPTLVVERTYSLEGTKAMIRKIAGELGLAAEGEKLVSTIDQQLKEAAQLVSKSGTPPKVLCIYNRGTSAVDIAGTGTFAEILPYAGAVSAIKGVEGYKPLNAEALIAANPDVILMFESGLQSIGGIDGLLRIPGVLQTNAGRQKRVIAMEGIKLSNFGPRFGEAVKELTAKLYNTPQSN